MTISKFAINFVIVFLLYGVYMIVAGVLFPMAAEPMMAIKRVDGDAIGAYVLWGHVFQTIAFVWLFMKTITDGSWKQGAIFGTMFGLVLLGTDAVWYGTMAAVPADVAHYSMMLNLIVSALVGATTALIQGAMNKRTAT